MTREQRELVRQERDRAARAAVRGRYEAERDIETIVPRLAPPGVPGSVTNMNRRWRRRRGLCVGCGGHLDDFTPGCKNCRARHEMRFYNAHRSAA